MDWTRAKSSKSERLLPWLAMRNYHALTPFSRFQNLEKLIRLLEKMPVTWHVIFDEGLPFDIHFNQSWIQKSYCPRSEPFWSMWADALNRFISAGRIDPNGFYCILNDDDLYEPDFFHKIEQHTGEVIICSMKRGDHTPPGTLPERAHGTDTLEAKPENMVPGRVGAEQMIVSGRVFQTCGFSNSVCADGECIAKVCSQNGVDYAPEAFVWFNALEPGRWDSLP